jgi:hypothetical protein
MALFPEDLPALLGGGIAGQVTAGVIAQPIDAKKFHICGMEDF